MTGKANNGGFVDITLKFKELTTIRLLTEFFGSFTVVYFSNWAFLQSKLVENKNSTSNYAIVVGMIMCIMSYLGSKHSGGIYNPGVCFALLCAKAMKMSVFVAYVAVQFLAGFLACITIWRQQSFSTLLLIEDMKIYFGTPNTELEAFEDGNDEWAGVFAPMLITFAYILGFVIITIVYLYCLIERKFDRNLYGIVIGALYCFMIVCNNNAVPGCYNPIRIAGNLMTFQISSTQFFMLISPFIGAPIGTIVYKNMIAEEDIMAVFEDDEA